MAAIPQVDVVVNLRDLGFALPIVTEGDTSSTLGQFGLNIVSPTLSSFGGGCAGGTSADVANFPQYNSGFTPPTETPFNYEVTPTGLVPHAQVAPTPGFNVQGSIHRETGTVMMFDFTNVFTTGAINAKVTTWPGPLDYSTAGMVPLVIPGTAPGFSVFTWLPVLLDDASLAWCIAAFNNTGGPNPGGFAILLVKPDLTTSDWLIDQYQMGGFGFATATMLLNGVNYQADMNLLPTITVYTQDFNFVTGNTINPFASGDVNADAGNAFSAFHGATPFFTDNGFFGIDNVSGNDTGCWYCALDCSAFGQLTFTMPDASLGPSSSQSVWNNFNFAGAGAFTGAWFPQTDVAGNWWWIELPLCDGGGNILIQPLTSEVYSSLPLAGGSARLYGTFIAFSSAAGFSGGTK